MSIILTLPALSMTHLPKSSMDVLSVRPTEIQPNRPGITATMRDFLRLIFWKSQPDRSRPNTLPMQMRLSVRKDSHQELAPSITWFCKGVCKGKILKPDPGIKINTPGCKQIATHRIRTPQINLLTHLTHRIYLTDLRTQPVSTRS